MEKKKTKVKEGKMEKKKIVGTLENCGDVKCPIHGNLKTRGREFKGIVIKKFQKRITIEFERMIYIRKYERYSKSKTKIHARLPDCMRKQINKGDLVKVKECRPLSKIVHTVVIEKIRDASENEGGNNK